MYAAKQIEDLIAKDEWKRARIKIRRQLEKEPNNHFYLSRLALTHYEERRYARALAITQKALKLAPCCPMVLWEYAGELGMLGREREAISIRKSLIRRGARRIAFGECGEGLPDARRLLNDCRYRMAFEHDQIGERTLAIRYLRAYLSYRRRGVTSIYPIAEVRSKLKTLLDDESRKRPVGGVKRGRGGQRRRSQG